MAIKVFVFVALAGVIAVYAAPNGPVQKVQIISREEDPCNVMCQSVCAAEGYAVCEETKCYCEAPMVRNITLPRRKACDFTCNDECASYGLPCAGYSCWCSGSPVSGLFY